MDDTKLGEDTNTDFIAYTWDTEQSDDFTEGKREPKDEIIKIQLFSKEDLFGSYFSCIYKGRLRIHVTFTRDSDQYKDEILELIRETFQTANGLDGKLWIGDHNMRLIEFLKRQLNLSPDPEKFLYESHELIMTRDKFHYQFDQNVLEVRPFQEEYIDEYLMLLNHSMSFKIPPYDYIRKKEMFLEEFRILDIKHAFEAFWKDNELIGLYWLGGTEVDHLAVSEKYQGLGYGKQILSRAIENVFHELEVEYAWLLVVGWNSKAFNFYRKFGMEEKAFYLVPYTEE